MKDSHDVGAAYLDAAFDRMLEVARRSGRRLNDRPLGPTTNSVASLVVHCVAVCEFWLGHVGLDRPSIRDRDGEFGAQASLAELEAVVARGRAQVASDLAALGAGLGVDSEVRVFLVGGTSDEALVTHLVEELFQHLGHMELAIDAFVAAGTLGEPLHHLAVEADWRAAVAAGGPYEVSTAGRSLREEGFIHCSFADQVGATARRFYPARDDVLLLEVDAARLEVPVRVENLDGGDELFPHVYGPLPLEAVVSVRPISWRGR